MGYVKTDTEVSADNSALMRNIKKHGNAIARAITDVAHATMAYARALGEEIPPEGEVTVQLDDSIVQDTDAEKKQDMAEVAAGLMQRWEYRCKWYGEDEKTARKRAWSRRLRPRAPSPRARGQPRSARADSLGRARLNHGNASAERGWSCGMGLGRSTPPRGRGRGAVNDAMRGGAGYSSAPLSINSILSPSMIIVSA